MGIGEHSNIVEAIEQELDMIAKYQDQIDIINKYFKKIVDKMAKPKANLEEIFNYLYKIGKVNQNYF